MASEIESDSTFNPQRRLCPDGGCVGIIGGDGRCTVCGTSDTGEVTSPPFGSGDHDDFDQPEDSAAETNPNAGETNSGFDSNRRLCSDDSCIGVIGDDNRCRECGKTADS